MLLNPFTEFCFNLALVLVCAALGWLAHDVYDDAKALWNSEVCDD
jgi:hypothetical protein